MARFIIFATIFFVSALSVSSKLSSDEVPDAQTKLQARSLSPALRESCSKSFDAPGNRVNTSDRLRRLRLRMKASNYDVYIVPSNDEHQSEFVADYDKRREFITGFTGSAGTAVILQDSAALWTDGRYYIQAENELDCNWILMKANEVGTPTLNDWLTGKLTAGSNVGADAKLIPYDKWLYLADKLEKEDINLVQDSSNLIDDIWNIAQGRVPESVSHVFTHDVKYAGQSWKEKVQSIRNVLKSHNADGIILTALDEIAWLFNLRGSDTAFTPVFKAYAFVSDNYLRLYIKRLKLTPEVEKYLCPDGANQSECVKVTEYNNAIGDLKKIVADSGNIMVPSTSSYAIVNLVPEEKRSIENGPSPVALLKVVKNSVEIAGMKNAAMKDSVAIVDFMAMLEQEIKTGKHWDEMKAAAALGRYRKEQKLNQGESFSAVSAFGPNGAIIHYQPQISTNRNINTKHLYLLDSGGQYLDGTTDITCTFHFGEPTDFEVEAYTRVLMGVIDLITMVFPDGVRDIDLDILARRSLYSVGLDYLHGTGHGIGSFLGVHEGPIGIGTPATGKGFPLRPGMFMSNEPGYYEAEKFGIRLETMMMVTRAHTPHSFYGRKYYTFEAVSFVPFEPKLIDLHLLSKKQKEWLNWYNMKSRNSIGIELRRQNRERGLKWLLSKTEFIPVEQCPNFSCTLHSTYLKPSLFISFVICALIIL